MLELRIGNLYCRVDKKKATKEELDSLHQLLAVKVEGHFFSPAFKRGMWDGLRKFFHRGTGAFYSGLLLYVKERLPQFEFIEIDERIKPIVQNNSLNLKGIELRPYQEKMIYEAISVGRGIISAPPNSGKTEIACGIIQRLGLPAVFLTHRLALLDQTRERFEKRLGVEIGIMGRGEMDIKDINVFSVTSLVRKLEEPEIKDLLRKTPILIIDECHHTSSTTFEKCVKASGSYFRYGLSATPLLRDDVSNMLVRGLLGSEISVVTNEELIRWGISAHPSVYLFEVNTPTFPLHYPYFKTYEEGIIKNVARNSLIVKSAKRFVDLQKSVFIIVFRIEHGQILTDMLKEAGVGVEFIRGEGSSPLRNSEILKLFSEKKLSCIVSSSISDEGLDVPSLDCLIIAVGDRSALKLIQRVGRGLRKKKSGDNRVQILDFMDLMNSHLKRHSTSRLETYHKLGFDLYEVRDPGWEKVIELN
jgi:superfamily II DNA or RNA helicase